MLAFSNDYYGFIFRVTQSVELFCTYVIFKQIAEKEYISIHGPEHHILDGASLLVAYKNAGGEIDL